METPLLDMVRFTAAFKAVPELTVCVQICTITINAEFSSVYSAAITTASVVCVVVASRSVLGGMGGGGGVKGVHVLLAIPSSGPCKVFLLLLVMRGSEEAPPLLSSGCTRAVCCTN
jgi:hypothetical protein